MFESTCFKVGYLANLFSVVFRAFVEDEQFRFPMKMESSLIGVQSGDSGGISGTGETPQERGFRDEEAHRPPLRKRPLGTEINRARSYYKKGKLDYILKRITQL